MTDKLFIVEVSNQNGKSISAKVMKRINDVAVDYHSDVQKLDKSYVNIPFDNEDMAKRCALRLVSEASVSAPMFKGCVIDAVQDQPRSERHYVVEFHRY